MIGRTGRQVTRTLRFRRVVRFSFFGKDMLAPFGFGQTGNPS